MLVVILYHSPTMHASSSTLLSHDELDKAVATARHEMLDIEVSEPHFLSCLPSAPQASMQPALTADTSIMSRQGTGSE